MARDRERSTPTRERHEGTVTKKSTAKIGKAEIPIKSSEDRVVVDDLQEIKNPARIRVSAGVTQQTKKQFESIRVDVAIEMPCAPTEKAIKKCYDKVSALVADLIEDEIEYAQERME